MKSNNTHVSYLASIAQEKEKGFGRFTPISKRYKAFKRFFLKQHA
jgi:hypothetical protein